MGEREVCPACGKPLGNMRDCAIGGSGRDHDGPCRDADGIEFCPLKMADACASTLGGWPAIVAREREACARAEAERDAAVAREAMLREAVAGYAEWHGSSCATIAENGPDACTDEDCPACAVDRALNDNMACGDSRPGAALLREVERLRAIAEAARAVVAAEASRPEAVVAARSTGARLLGAIETLATRLRALEEEVSGA